MPAYEASGTLLLTKTRTQHTPHVRSKDATLCSKVVRDDDRFGHILLDASVVVGVPNDRVVPVLDEHCVDEMGWWVLWVKVFLVAIGAENNHFQAAS